LKIYAARSKKRGIVPFLHIFLFSFLQLHKTVSIKILQKRITEFHSELRKLFRRSSRHFLGNQKKKRFLETGVVDRKQKTETGFHFLRAGGELFLSNID